MIQNTRAGVVSVAEEAQPETRKGAGEEPAPAKAGVEHVFRVLKCQFGYRKVRYRGIAKNGAQVFTLLARVNLYLVRGKLMAMRREAIGRAAASAMA